MNVLALWPFQRLDQDADMLEAVNKGALELMIDERVLEACGCWMVSDSRFEFGECADM
jgi:hypothetical protein